nr:MULTISPECIES: 3-isopropylmalate dehydratase large subunit [unclassified Microcoleus]
MTITEKILAKASGRTKVEPGDNIWVETDVLMTHDVCGPGTIGVFKKEFGDNAKVWNPDKIVLIPDHYIFTNDERANRNVDILRDFAAEQGIKYFYDITDRSNFKANPDYKGVCHIALAQEGHTRPGEVLFGTDSHTCNAGAFGQFATGIGNTDAAFIMGTGKLLIKVPATMRFVLNGELPDYLLAKDLILQIIGDISVAGANYRSMEFAGDTVERLTMEERMTLCNMVIEAGGKNGTVAADKTTFDYVNPRTNVPFEAFYSDEGAQFYSDRTYDVSKLEPVVAKPHSPDNRDLARNCSDVKIDRVYIGSCTGGKTSDFLSAARILKGNQVKVPTYLVPATQKVYEDLFVTKYDGQTLSEIFLAAGCIEPAAPSCAACLGGPKDTFGRMNEPEICVSTTNRNFPGRMGNKEAQVYLASPYTAAASALTGHVTDPREFLR